jgi:hypothetical protein
MFGKVTMKHKNYILVAVKKNDIMYCGSYDNHKKETITSLTTGEVFYDIKDFVNSILQEKTENEWKDCLYYNETKKRWRSVKYLLKKN